MLPNDIDVEIEKLKLKKMDLTNKMNATTDYEEKETLRQDLQSIQQQISTLEKLKG